jgi:hypothetical protein
MNIIKIENCSREKASLFAGFFYKISTLMIIIVFTNIYINRSYAEDVIWLPRNNGKTNVNKVIKNADMNINNLKYTTTNKARLRKDLLDKRLSA